MDSWINEDRFSSLLQALEASVLNLRGKEYLVSGNNELKQNEYLKLVIGHSVTHTGGYIFCFGKQKFHCYINANTNQEHKAIKRLLWNAKQNFNHG